MSFIKSLILAIVATTFLTYVLGTSLIELLDIDLYMGNQLVEPIKAVSISALVVCLIVVAAMAVVLSVFGSIIFVGLIGVGAAIMVMVGVFWPVLLVALVIWLMVRDSKPKEVVYR